MSAQPLLRVCVGQDKPAQALEGVHRYSQRSDARRLAHPDHPHRHARRDGVAGTSFVTIVDVPSTLLSPTVTPRRIATP